MDVLDRVALLRLGLLRRRAGPVTPQVAAAAVVELARVGVRLADAALLTDPTAAAMPDIVATLREHRGEKGPYAPLFRGFPDRLPAVDDLGLRYLLGSARLAWRRARVPRRHDVAWRSARSEVTDAELRAALDFTDLGWWPASSVPQDVALARLDKAFEQVLPGDARVEWLDVALADDAEITAALRRWCTDGLTAPSPLRTDVRADLAAVLHVLGVPPDVVLDDVRFRETRSLLLRLLWDRDPEALRHADLTPDDLLRLFADLTGTDAALRTGVRFPRLTRAQRRLVVDLLEASPRLPDVFRRRGLWLAVARGLHLAEYDAPRVRDVFARLRESRHDRTSLGSRVERAFGNDHPEAVRLLAAGSPGALVRSLRRLAALAPDDTALQNLCTAVRDTAPAVPLRVLLAARCQVADNGRSYPRAAFTTQGKPLLVEGPPGRLALAPVARAHVLAALDTCIDAQIRERDDLSGTRVWVDPVLDRVLVPDQLRSTAPGLSQSERGSWLPLGEAAVLRLFVHWREGHVTSDLDLSCLALDDAFRIVSQVSWTRLTDGTMTHSGDLTSAPDGAQEFLDVRLDAARSRPGWRYLVPVVLRYAGPAFAALPEAHTGWMLRDDTSSDRRTFDPATVVDAFPLAGAGSTCVPFAVDLQDGLVLRTDLYLRTFPSASVERDGRGFTPLVTAVARRGRTKTSVAHLVRRHVAVRGGSLVDDRASADVTVGLDAACTYDVRRPEAFLADWL